MRIDATKLTLAACLLLVGLSLNSEQSDNTAVANCAGNSAYQLVPISTFRRAANCSTPQAAYVTSTTNPLQASAAPQAPAVTPASSVSPTVATTPPAPPAANTGDLAPGPDSVTPAKATNQAANAVASCGCDANCPCGGNCDANCPCKIAAAYSANLAATVGLPAAPAGYAWAETSYAAPQQTYYSSYAGGCSGNGGGFWTRGPLRRLLSAPVRAVHNARMNRMASCAASSGTCGTSSTYSVYRNYGNGSTYYANTPRQSYSGVYRSYCPNCT